MHGLAVYLKEGLPFAWDLSLESSADLCLCFRLALLHLVSYYFSLYRWSPSLALCKFFYSISSNIDQVLSINPSANVWTGLPILVELIDLKWPYSGTFPTWIPDCDSHSPTLLDLFLASDASICSTMAFPLLGNSDHIVVSVLIDFPSNPQWDASFNRIAYDYSCADWDILLDYLTDVP